jgi:hypothetical protein
MALEIGPHPSLKGPAMETIQEVSGETPVSVDKAVIHVINILAMYAGHPSSTTARWTLDSYTVTYAVGAAGPFDMALEIGPHPSLKGPAMETIQATSSIFSPCTLDTQVALPLGGRWIVTPHFRIAAIFDTYWSNNMVKPVLFSQAVTYAVGAAGPFDMALESSIFSPCTLDTQVALPLGGRWIVTPHFRIAAI